MMSTSIIVEEWRDLWSFKIDFIFACFAYVFSITNFFKLPALIYTYGGLAFLAGYGASLIVCCLPIIVMELAVGQLTGRAPVQALLSVCPLFKGVGVAQILYSLVTMCYLTTWLGYIAMFLFFYFYTILEGPQIPWIGCANEWASPSCISPLVGVNATVNYMALKYSPNTSISEYLSAMTSPVASITEISQLHWMLICGLGAIWIGIFKAIFAGVRLMGKALYLTLFLPLGLFAAMLTYILLIDLDVAQRIAVQVLELTDWNVMLKWEFWQIVFKQSFYAVGLGFGAFITLGSYNKRNNNLICDAFVIIFGHVLTSALLVCTALAFMGHFAQLMDVDLVEYFLKDAPLTNRPFEQLHFYLAAVSTFQYGKVWSGILLFAVLFLVINTCYVLGLNILATLEDAFGEKASRCLPRFMLAFLICGFGCALSLIHTTDVGVYTLELSERYLDLITPWTIIFFEVLAIAWFYCAWMLGKDIRAMVNPCCCWVTGWFWLLPLYLLPVVPIYIMAAPESGTLWMYDLPKSLPAAIMDWSYSECVGWTIAAVPLLPIPLLMLYMIIKTCVRGPGITKWQRFKYTIISPLRYEIVKPTPPPRYTATAPGYVLLPQAPLAEPEQYNDVYGEHSHAVRVSNI